MNIYVLFGLLGVCSFSLAAPEPPSWPYSHDLRYYYGYPGKTPYVYRASIEDDEEPLDRSRQDSGQLVSTLIHNAAVKQQDELKNFGNERPAVETGSAPPVQQERPGDSPKVVAPSSPHVVKPGVVNPPAFPPARKPPPPPPPPTKPAPEEEEDEDDEDDEESNEDDEEDEEEDDEERRRNEPIDIVTTQTPENATSSETLEVVRANVSQPVRQVVEDSNTNSAVLDVVEIKPDNEDNISDEASLDGVEAFVPGYVTDQGEVLVPVDTVTGDQPISIVPDPYTPPSRGVSLNYYGYNAEGLPGRVYRQEVFGEEDESQEDESQEDEDEEDESVKEVKEEPPKKKQVAPPKPPKVPLHLIPASAPTNEDDELDSGHQRYRNEAFPPSRSPLLYPVTFRYNGGYLTGPFDRPVTSSEVFQYVEPRPVVRRRPAVSPNNIFYAYTQQQQQQQQRRRTPQPITVAIPASALYQTRRTQGPSRPDYGQGLLPYLYNAQRPTYSNEQYGPSYRPTTLHNPGEKLKIKSSYELLVEPHSSSNARLRTKKRPNKKRVSNKKKTQSVKRRPVTVISRPPAAGRNPYRQPITPYRQPVGPYRQPMGPYRQPVTPYRQPLPASHAPVLYSPVYNVRPLERVPAQGYRQPPYLSSAYNEYQNFLKGLAAGYYGNRPNFNRPTPVIQQDEPATDSSEATVGQERKPKTRREAKKVKKQKKIVIKKKEDPLNLFPLKTETKKPNM
ncbi:unnamed protein product [Allacma fusca]|uniref:Uncharacterized protein n=1 Tax=Allacma fusca TaxID=39272 RepID=A0A8J2PJD0_9HEXA|nr:unnamed protein product [Allacma fusca]